MSTSDAGGPSRLGALILIWLSTRSKGHGTRSDLGKALKAILEQRWSTAEQRQALDGELASLEQTGQLTPVRKAAFVLTESGRRAGLAALGVEALPAKSDWKIIKRKYLLARALGLPAPVTAARAKGIQKIEGVRAAILAHHHQLGIGDYATLKQAKDALAWRALGVEKGGQFTLNAVLKLLLNRSLDPAKPQEPEKALAQLAAKAVTARRADASEIQLAALRRWLNDPGAVLGLEPRGDATSGSSVARAAESPDDDGAFAARVLAAARGSKTGRFGDDKVFIAHVFKQLAAEGAAVGALEVFKERLVSAHLDGRLSLSRADMVEAMAAEDVSASETQHGESTFHFVRIQQE